VERVSKPVCRYGVVGCGTYANAVVRGRDADAAAALLDDDGQDEAVVDTRLSRYLLDRVPDSALR
jgi:hypothetical protein